MANAIVGSVYILLDRQLHRRSPRHRRRNLSRGVWTRNRFGNLIRFTADVLNGVPSIVIGIVAYGWWC